ncbi:hypothetical protein [Pleomorphomonas sp. PLEO]|uniref:hypothetical protein n=1 Tax=Pleomorphomonas sp. PLEO TaxID=3239306 RepID=UPI00351DC6ED
MTFMAKRSGGKRIDTLQAQPPEVALFLNRFLKFDPDYHQPSKQIFPQADATYLLVAELE